MNDFFFLIIKVSVLKYKIKVDSILETELKNWYTYN